jgi:hypothetical protein
MNIKKGDILLIHSKNFIGRLIQFGMNVERWRWLSFKPFWKKVCNHAAICIDEFPGINDVLIAEAMGNGIIIHLFNPSYGKSKNIEITIYRPPLSKNELTRIYNEAIKYKGVKYQFINFLQYIPKILFGIWLGRTHVEAEDKLYCTEYVALVLNKITCGRLFKKYWRTSPAGLQSWCEKNCKKIEVMKK